MIIFRNAILSVSVFTAIIISGSVLAQDSDGDLVAAGGVTEPVALPWSADTVGEAIGLFDFTIVDGGTADGFALNVSQVVINVTGTASDADRNKITWRLNGPGASNVVGIYNGGSDTITFTGLSISVSDGMSETYTINGYYNDNTGLTDGQTVNLSVDGDTDLTVGGGTTTQMGSTSAVNNGSGTQISDDIAPVVTSVSVPANSTYGASDNLDFTVNFDENITVNTVGGTPRLTLVVGANNRFASYLSGSGTSALLFRYTVQAGEEDSDGIALGAAIDPNLGTLRDAGDNDANNALNSVGSLASVLVDALAPVVSEVTPVSTPTNDSTPDVTFNNNEAGTLAVGGSCGSGDEGAIGSGNNTITLTQTDNSTALASGTYSDCTVTVTDAAGNSSNVLTLTSFTIDFAAPTLDTNAGLSVDEGDTDEVIANTALSASDALSAAADVTYTLVTAPINGELKNNGSVLVATETFTQADIDGSLLTYDHDGSETVSDSFEFNIQDAAGNATGNATFNITVIPANDPPETNPDPDSTNEDTAVVIDVLANDSDPDGSLVASTVSVVTDPTNGSTSVNAGTGAITYTPDEDFEGIETFNYTVEDNNAEPSASTLVTITVNPINDPPVAVDDDVETLMDTPVSIDVAFNDVDVDDGDDPDPSTIVVTVAASNGTAVFNGVTNQVDYAPNGGHVGPDSFSYTIEDSTGSPSNEAVVSIEVTRDAGQGPGGDGAFGPPQPIPSMGDRATALLALLLLAFGAVVVRRSGKRFS